MKHTFILAILVTLSVSLPVFAATTPPVATKSAQSTPPTNTTEETSKIDDLKERLSQKVDELKKSSPKAIFGTVSAVTISTLTVDTPSKAIKIELTDDITVFQMLKGKRTVLGIDDVEKNDVVTIFGQYDETLDILRAEQIFIEATTRPSRIHGIITILDKTKNVVTIKGIDGQTYTVDYETTTKTSLYTPEKGVEKSGFSKLEKGMFLSVLGAEDVKNPLLYKAIRIVHFAIPGAQAPLAISPTPTSVATSSGTPKPTATTAPTKKPTPTESE